VLEQNEDGTIDYSKFVKIAAKQVLKIHAMDLVTIHLQVKMHQKGQEEVSCPNYPHLKRCAWYAILADPNHNRIMDFKRCVLLPISARWWLDVSMTLCGAGSATLQMPSRKPCN
jgi:hypothetical protein